MPHNGNHTCCNCSHFLPQKISNLNWSKVHSLCFFAQARLFLLFFQHYKLSNRTIHCIELESTGPASVLNWWSQTHSKGKNTQMNSWQDKLPNWKPLMIDEVTTSSIWFWECQKCAKWPSKHKVDFWRIKNIKHIALISSVLVLLKNNKNKWISLNQKVCTNF